jgi:cytidylate kinase
MPFETTRKPDFQEDIRRYGKLGERMFTRIFSQYARKRQMDLIDVSEIQEFQDVDIDFLISPKIVDLENVNLWRILKDRDIRKFEVKVDTRALTTGNLPFEIISHNRLRGWSYLTKADYIVFFLSDMECTRISSLMMVDMPKWKEMVESRRAHYRINHIYNEGIVDLLVPIQEMRNEHVIVHERTLLGK